MQKVIKKLTEDATDYERKERAAPDKPGQMYFYGRAEQSRCLLEFIGDMSTRDARQRQTLQWAINTFGEATAANHGERISRFAEEALELAQAAGMDRTSVRC